MHTIYTMGYSGWAPARLAATALELRAAFWDIRYSPMSRRPEWRGPALRAAIGPAYVHVKALGNKNYRGGPIELLNPAAVVDLARGVLAERPLILLCGCKVWHLCHRAIAADFLARQLGAPIEHLEPPARGVQVVRNCL